MEAEVVTATRQHARKMAPHMRATDMREVWASGHHTPADALRLSVQNSAKAWTALLDDEPIVMFGVGCRTVLDDTGSPWLLGTDRIAEVKHRFLRESRCYIYEMLAMFPRLENYVDARNKITLRWLKWCGFSIFPAEPYGLDWLPFHRILLRSKDV